MQTNQKLGHTIKKQLNLKQFDQNLPKVVELDHQLLGLQDRRMRGLLKEE